MNRTLHPFAWRLAGTVCALGAGIVFPFPVQANDVPPPRPLLIAFSSFRDRPAFASIHFYRHDGVGQGQLAGGIPPLAERGDTRPSLTSDGRTCACVSKQPGGLAPLIRLFDLKRGDWLPDPELSSGEFAVRIDVRITGDGAYLGWAAWDRPGQPGGWDIQLYERQGGRLVDLPKLNSTEDDRDLSISGDGRRLAFVSNRPGGAGLSDIYVYDRKTSELLPLPGLITASRELDPAISADGRRLAFVSDRPGGAGGKDIYLYDCDTGRVSSPPGLNSAAHEQTPCFSPDGRYLVFVSERTQGAGERDVYLFDLLRSRVLPVPGLNSAAEDFDPVAAFDPGFLDGGLPAR